eukprot:COSAG01_NODE_6247_length_3771_cov_379.905229_2_plen_97_part_00
MSQLTACRSQLPPGVNPRAREIYLTDCQFEQALGVGRSQFASLPQWRRDLHKASAGLLDGATLDAVTMARFRSTSMMPSSQRRGAATLQGSDTAQQ